MVGSGMAGMNDMQTTPANEMTKPPMPTEMNAGRK